MEARRVVLLQLDDLLRVEREAILVERVLDALHPVHLADPVAQVEILLAVDMDPVAALLLGHEAGDIGRPHDVVARDVARRVVHEADARRDAEPAAVPDEADALDRGAHALGEEERLADVLVAEEDAELVAAEAREHGVLAEHRLETRADETQQRVAGLVAARVVDDLELIEIDEHDRPGRRRPGARRPHRPSQAFLERPAIEQPRQFVVRGLPRELALDLSPLRQDASDAPDGQAGQHAGQREIGQHQQRFDEPRPGVEGIGEGDRLWGDLVVDLDEALAQRRCLGRRMDRACGLAHPVDLEDRKIRLLPTGDRLLEIGEAAEVAEHPNHAREVFRRIAGLLEGPAGGDHVQWPCLEELTALSVLERDSDGSSERVEVLLLVRVEIEVEEVDRLVLALRPEALAGDEGACAGEDEDAEAANGHLDQDDDDEGPRRNHRMVPYRFPPFEPT